MTSRHHVIMSSRHHFITPPQRPLYSNDRARPQHARKATPTNSTKRNEIIPLRHHTITPSCYSKIMLPFDEFHHHPNVTKNHTTPH